MFYRDLLIEETGTTDGRTSASRDFGDGNLPED